MIVFCTVLLSRFHLEVAVVAAQMIRCLCGGSGRWWMVARTMHGAVLQAFYLEASGLSVMRSSVAKCFPEALEVRAPLMPSLPNMPTIRIRRSSVTCDCFSDPVVDQFAAIHHWFLTRGSSNLQKERSTLEYNRAAGFDKYCILVMQLMRPMYLHTDAQ